MSIIVDITVPASGFLLSHTLSASPEMDVEIERVVAHPDNRVTPYFWIAEGDYDSFETAIRDDPTVDNVVRVDDLGDARLYRSDWTGSGSGLVDAYREVDMVILEASGRDDTWSVRLRFDDPRCIDDFRDYCADHDLSVSVQRIYRPDDPMATGRFGLTETQHDTLVAALDAGYYELPREVTHAELAERLDVSQQAVSDRLHRAHGNLVQHALTIDGPENSAR